MEGRAFIGSDADSELGAVVGLPFDDPNGGIAGRTVSLGVCRLAREELGRKVARERLGCTLLPCGGLSDTRRFESVLVRLGTTEIQVKEKLIFPLTVRLLVPL